MRWWFIILVVVVVPGLLSAEPLKPASRWDIGITPYKFGLRGDLRRTLAEYRKAVNQADIDVGENRQMRAETERLRQLVESRGYYQASIDGVFDRTEGKPKYEIRLGPRYRIASIVLRGNYQPEANDWRSLKVGKPLTASAVLEQQSALEKDVAEHACYFEQTVSHEVQLNDATATADITFIANVAKPAKFGTIAFTGTGRINQRFLRKTTGIESGSCYHRAEIDSAVFSLFDTGLFRQVRPTFVLTDQGLVDVTFTTSKRKKRTLSAGVGVKSELGPAANLGWQHRDLMGKAQKLTLGTEVQRNLQTYKADLEIPSFFDRRNRLSLENELEHDDTTDVESYQYSTTAVMERTASWKDYYEYGIGYKRTLEDVDDQWKVYHQLRFPLLYRYDTVTNPFNPVKGRRFSIALEPVLDIEDDLTPFIKTTLGAQLFLADDSNVSLASRVQWDSLWYGSWLGSTLENVPQSELYSAGGSNTVRGYDYQSIKLASNSSVGGSDRWLFSTEVRTSLNKSWGIVGFWDAGSVSNHADPFDQDVWYNGIGLGIRYYTRFAPLRLDIAFPVDQDFEEDHFHVYFSLGQAF